MSLSHLLHRLRIRTARKVRVTRYLAQTQPRARLPRQIAYVWLAPLRRMLRPGVEAAVDGRQAVFMPGTYYDLEVWRDVFEDGDVEIALPRPPRVIFDLGAHVGMSALYYALKYPGATVYAFEAQARNLQQPTRNTRNVPNVRAFHYAICGEDREVVLHVHAKSSVSHSLMEPMPGGGAERVQGRSLDSLMDEHGIEHLDLVKFNIEGIEFEAFGCFSRRNETGAYIGYLHFDLAAGEDERFLDRFEGYDIRTAPSKMDRIKIFAVRRNES